MIRRTALVALTLVACAPFAASAQSVTQSLKGLNDVTKGYILATAELLDEDLYAFRPTDDVRSMGELLAHLADGQFEFCSVADETPREAPEHFEDTRTTKAGIIEALHIGFTYCDEVYARMNDQKGSRTVMLFGQPNTALGVLAFNSAHNYEHYGNLVTYMRLNGIVPPSSR